MPSLERVCLVILDGWGLAPRGPGNAIALARTPVIDGLGRRCPHATLSASGSDVGLPAGQMGNSEVGHLTLGAGAAVPQTLTRIEAARATDGFAGNAVLREAMAGARRVHLIGLVSDGGVHAELAHTGALIELAAQLDVTDLVLHCITDGRDTPPQSAAGYLAEIEERCARHRAGRVASVVGRFYAMDRDQRWERTQQTHDLLVYGHAPHHAYGAAAAAREAYRRGETDEFIAPTRVGDEGLIGAGDSVICVNFRPDRMRQLVRALADPALQEAGSVPGWQGRGGASPVTRLATMTPYQEGWPYPAAFPTLRPEATLAGVLADAGARQLHVAETEKYAHVTYFFNGGVEQLLPGERRELVPSRRDVRTYDRAPEMSAELLTRTFLGAFRENAPTFSVVNFANADMVGHSGQLAATMRAAATVDRCLLTLLDGVLGAGTACVITADHGNAEQMLTGKGEPHTAHTTNRVPLILDGAPVSLRGRGTLADVAPTILELLGIPAPAAMTGRSLLERSAGRRAPGKTRTRVAVGN